MTGVFDRDVDGALDRNFDPALDPDFDFDLEPERYELREPPRFDFALERRDFLKIVGGGIAIACLVPAAVSAADSAAWQDPERRGGARADDQIAAWLHLGEDGAVTVYTGKVEVGQDIRTSLAQAVAEELCVALADVRLVMGDTARVPFDRGTFGSRTTPQMSRQLRRAAAAAREHLRRLASERFGVPEEDLVLREGHVVRADGERLAYGALTAGQRIAEAIADAPLADPGEWRVMGRPAAKVTAAEMVTGRHAFASDLRPPGVLYGKVLRPPRQGARLVRCATEAAAALPGVVVVVDGDFAGVAAPTEHAATAALAALRPEWQGGERGASDANLSSWLKEHAAAEGRRSRAEVEGDVERALADAEHTIRARYDIAYIAHAPLEPRAAVAEWRDGRLTVSTGTQRPFGVRQELARAFRLAEDAVRVLVPDTGSGYGGKHSGECAVEAARLAKAAGKPVKLVWTREEEFRHAYFRPGGVIDVAAGARDGKLTAWEFHNWNSGRAGIDAPYAARSRHIAFHASEAPLRQGSYRALAATANHFARECAIDELAHACGRDPLLFRRDNLADPRVRAVLDAAAERFGFGRAPKPGRGHGLAAGTEKGGYVATCAEVAADRATGEVRVLRLVTAFECGAIVNPDGLANQVEGAVIMGLGGALFEAVRFAGGEIASDRFSRYRVPRFSDVPELDTVLVDRPDLPAAGAGEAPIVCVAPAIGNAIFAATGVRLRALPLVPNGLPK